MEQKSAVHTSQEGDRLCGAQKAEPLRHGSVVATSDSSHNHEPRTSEHLRTRKTIFTLNKRDSTDRVFPIRSVLSVDSASSIRSAVTSSSDSGLLPANNSATTEPHVASNCGHRPADGDATAQLAHATDNVPAGLNDHKTDTHKIEAVGHQEHTSGAISPKLPADDGTQENTSGTAPQPAIKGTVAPGTEDLGGLVTARFRHVMTADGHAVITGRDGETLQRCEDEPIHIPGAIQSFGALLAFEEASEGKLLVRIVSENAKRVLGYTPKQLFALASFTDILSDEQADNLLDHVDFVRNDGTDVEANGPEVFTMTIEDQQQTLLKLWCAMHVSPNDPKLVICEFELESDDESPLVPADHETSELTANVLDGDPTEEEIRESTEVRSRPLRMLRRARKRTGEAAAMEVFNIMSQVQDQLAEAPNLEQFLKVLVGVVKELSGFHRVMVYQFDCDYNGKVVTELVDPRATKDLYKGLHFPASDIPKQARDLYKVNKVRLLYDREKETARLICRTAQDLENPVDLTHSYLRAMSPIHIKYLRNMAVRSSMSISINAFNELWGLISCHAYGQSGTRVSFPIRKMCRLVGDSASRNIERLSYASRLQARKLINTNPTTSNPSGYIIASSEDLLSLFNADSGLLSIQHETKILGKLQATQEALALLEFLRLKRFTSVIQSTDIRFDFQDLHYPPGFTGIAGLLLVPLSVSGEDFIVFFRKGLLKEVRWAGNPYEKFVRRGTEGFLEPRTSFRSWSETVVGKCKEWLEEEIETAGVLCLVYGKFIEVWRQKQAAMHNTELTKLLLRNSAHEVRTPLNAIINYLEIALEGSLDVDVRDSLVKSHSASKSLIYVINDLLDLTKTEASERLLQDESFALEQMVHDAVHSFAGEARRKNISFDVVLDSELPKSVIGDPRRMRQAISNVTANAIQATSQGSVTVEIAVSAQYEQSVDIEVVVSDTGRGLSPKQLDDLFAGLEQVQGEQHSSPYDTTHQDSNPQASEHGTLNKTTLGLGLAVVARIVRNMNGQLRLRSEEGKGSRFVIVFPCDLPTSQTAPPRSDLTTSPSLEHGANSFASMDLVKTTSPDRPARLPRSGSGGSLRSRRPTRSQSTAAAGSSEVDAMLEAIQANPSLQRPRSTDSMGRLRAGLLHIRASVEPHESKLEKKSQGPPHLRGSSPPADGAVNVVGSSLPLRAIRMPADGAMADAIGTVAASPAVPADPIAVTKSSGQLTADKLNVLVAEDDPINSRILEKRLHKAGHVTFLTGNGEDCSSRFGDKPGQFDVVLMDMQMPIVDGMTATKIIRDFEKVNSLQILSARAALNRRIPIIAVSASLVERERQLYMDAGFDGWLLKPVSFMRLHEIMNGIVDPELRRQNVYQPGRWELGGWFGAGAS